MLFLLPSSFILGAYGSYGSDIFEIVGILSGIFFLWGLIKIIQNGNEVEEDLESDQDIIHHLLDNDLPQEQ